MSTVTESSADSALQTHADITLLSMLGGAWVQAAIHVAARLGIADLLKYAPRSAEDIAMATGTHEGSMRRLLRALASIGIFEQARDGCYALTPLSQYLRTDLPESLHAVALAAGEPWRHRPWEELAYSVFTGQPAFPRVLGQEPQEFFSENPEAGTQARRLRALLSRWAAEALVRCYDFSSFRLIVEIRAGKGSVVTSLLRANPHARAIVLDAEEETRAVIQHVRSRDMLDRCDVVAGDMLEEVPAGGDLYVLRQVICDLDDARATRVLQNCRRAMAHNGRIVIVESLVEQGMPPALTAGTDLELLVMTDQGRERTHQETRNLMQAAGFEPSGAIPTGTAYCLLEGTPVPVP